MRISAFAKLNLTLDITGITKSGYHSLDMIMQSVSLCDTVTVTRTDCGIVCTCNRPLTEGAENIAYTAAKRYFGGDDGNVRIDIRKRIPMCGGLAGGSADAAAVLAALNRMFGRYSDEELKSIGLSLGSDVPFGLTGGTARVTGIGEKILPLEPLPDCVFVLASAGVKPSTREMYSRVDAAENLPRPDNGSVARAIASGDIAAAAAGFCNVFDAVWRDEETERLREIMRSGGALGCSVSGSGPTVFGCFADENTAQSCAEKLRGICGEVNVCLPKKTAFEFDE